MRVGFLITARLKSTRLPMKLLREIKGKPVICHMLDRVKLAKEIDNIVICTSTVEQDQPLVDIAGDQNVGCFRGDPDDVVLRLSDAADEYRLDYIVNITADCPFVDPYYADRVVDAFLRTDADLIRTFDLAHGAFSYGIRPQALKKVIEIKSSSGTEAWGRYFTDTDLFNVYDLPIENEFHRRPGLRMTLDYPEDLAFFEAVFVHLYKEGEVFSLDDILHLLDMHPEIIELNRHCGELYQKRWMAESEIFLKPRYDVSKAAVFGCGSIGQTHIRNLQDLGVKDIITLRSRKGHFHDLSPDIVVQEMLDLDELFAEKPDIAIISNPTSLHRETIERLVPHVKGIFVEKPLASSLDGIATLLDQMKSLKTLSFVGYNLRFHPVVQAIRETLRSEEIGYPLVFQCQVGHWLPDWHSYEDYRKTYAARADLGGGVTRTLIHEIDLAIELLGNVTEVCAVFPGWKSLDLEVDVIADLMLRHSSGAMSQIHLDFVQRPLQRCGVISCERGWIRYDLVNLKVAVQLAEDTSPRVIWEDDSYDGNQPYVEEMDTFLRYMKEGRVRHSLDAWSSTQSLAVVEAAFASGRTGCWEKLSDWMPDIE